MFGCTILTSSVFLKVDEKVKNWPNKMWTNILFVYCQKNLCKSCHLHGGKIAEKLRPVLGPANIAKSWPMDKSQTHLVV